MLGPHTITIMRAGVTAADYGNATQRDWDNPITTDVPGCSVQPFQAVENTVDRDNVGTRWTVWAPDGTDIQATDRVVWNNQTYEVDGDPQRWGFPPLSHVVINLRRSIG